MPAMASARVCDGPVNARVGLSVGSVVVDVGGEVVEVLAGSSIVVVVEVEVVEVGPTTDVVGPSIVVVGGIVVLAGTVVVEVVVEVVVVVLVVVVVVLVGGVQSTTTNEDAPPLKTPSRPMIKVMVTSVPRVSGELATVILPLLPSTSTSVTLPPPLATTRSLPGWTDSLFSARVRTPHDVPTSSSGTVATPSNVVTPGSDRTTVPTGISTSPTSCAAPLGIPTNDRVIVATTAAYTDRRRRVRVPRPPVSPRLGSLLTTPNPCTFEPHGLSAQEASGGDVLAQLAHFTWVGHLFWWSMRAGG